MSTSFHVDHPHGPTQFQKENSIDLSPIIRLVNEIQKSVHSLEINLAEKVTEQVVHILSGNMHMIMSEIRRLIASLQTCSQLVTTLQKDLKSIHGQLRREETNRKKAMEASDKKWQNAFRQTAGTEGNKQMETMVRTIIKEECNSLFQASEKRIEEMVRKSVSSTTSIAVEKGREDDGGNDRLWERSVVPRMGKRKRSSLSGSQLTSLSQCTDCYERDEYEIKRSCANDEVGKHPTPMQLNSTASNLFLIDDFFFSVCWEMAGNDVVSKMELIEYVESEADAQLISTFFSASPDDVMRLIEDKVGDFLLQLAFGEEPYAEVITRTSRNAVFCNREQYLRLKLGKTKRRLTDGKRFQGLWKVLQASYSLCKERKNSNKRELYYMNTDV